jgi:hypothetical protein
VQLLQGGLLDEGGHPGAQDDLQAQEELSGFRLSEQSVIEKISSQRYDN